MRILHTGDWHLGRTLLGAELLGYQRAFLDWLIALVHERDIDVVLVAGDVYDRAIPPVDAVRALSGALARLADYADVIVIPGNHDSAARLGFGAELMTGRVRILAESDCVDVPVLLSDDDGPVAFYGIPYLAPDLVRHRLASDPATPLARSHEAVLGAAMERIRRDFAARRDARSVVVAHAFVAGGDPSESEQDIRVGGVDVVSSSVFDGIDYVALGHLHGPQRVGGTDRLRYAGSPLAFSFGERNHRKSVTVVDLAADGSVAVDVVQTPVPRRLIDVEARIADIESGAFSADADAWVRVVVTDDVHPDRMYARVKQQFPHALAIVHQPARGRETLAVTVVTAASDPVAVAADFVAYATGGPPNAAERAVVRSAYETARATLNDGGR